MKKMILTTIVLLAATIAQASSTVVQSEKLSIAPSSIDKTIRLVDKTDAGSSQKKHTINHGFRGKTQVLLST